MQVRMENTTITAFVLFVNGKLRENFDCLETSEHRREKWIQKSCSVSFFFWATFKIYMHLAIYSALGSRFHHNHKRKKKTKHKTKQAKQKRNEMII